MRIMRAGRKEEGTRKRVSRKYTAECKAKATCCIIGAATNGGKLEEQRATERRHERCLSDSHLPREGYQVPRDAEIRAFSRICPSEVPGATRHLPNESGSLSGATSGEAAKNKHQVAHGFQSPAAAQNTQQKRAQYVSRSSQPAPAHSLTVIGLRLERPREREVGDPQRVAAHNCGVECGSARR